jgi:hypothetical protein
MHAPHRYDPSRAVAMGPDQGDTQSVDPAVGDESLLTIIKAIVENRYRFALEQPLGEVQPALARVLSRLTGSKLISTRGLCSYENKVVKTHS